MATYGGAFLTVGEKIRIARQAAGLTQNQLAEKCGCACGTIHQYEANKRRPSYAQLAKLAAALKIDVSDLVLENVDISRSENLEEDIYFKRVGTAFRDLNDLGRAAAAQRVEELTEIQKYKK